MKKLQESMAKFDEKYVKVETLSEKDKNSTYGGAKVRLMYGIPDVPALKYGVFIKDEPIIAAKYGVPLLKYGIMPMYGVPYPDDSVTE